MNILKKLMLLLLLTPVFCAGQIPDPQPGTYVNDSYGYLQDAEIVQLNKALFTIEKKYSVQVAIVLLPTIPEKYSIEDYAREIGRKWRVGHAKNGLVYVAAIDQRLQRLEVADHLEGTITDLTAKHLTGVTKAFFREGKYGAGLLELIKQLDINLQPAQQEQKKLTTDELKKKEAEGNGIGLLFSLLFSLLLGLSLPVGVFIYLNRRYKRQLKREQEEREKEQEVRLLKHKDNANADMEQFKEKFNDRKAYKETNRKAVDQVSSNPLYTPGMPIIDPDVYKGNSYSGGGCSGSNTSSSDSDYGNWGSSSSDSTSDSGSGYSGGGSSDNW